MKYQWALSTLEGAFANWNAKLTEIWGLVTQSPEAFRGGEIWNVIKSIHGTMQAIGLATLVLFFFLGVLKTGTYLELQRPQQAFRLVIRFAMGYILVVYGMDFMLQIMAFGQGIASSAMTASGIANAAQSVPAAMRVAVSKLSLLQAALFWVLGLVASICTTVMSIIILLQVYGRFFKMYIYIAISPIALSAAAGEGTAAITKTYLKSFALVCLEGLVVVLACVIFSSYASAPPNTGNTGNTGNTELTDARRIEIEQQLEIWRAQLAEISDQDSVAAGLLNQAIVEVETQLSGESISGDAFDYAWNYLTETLFSMLLLVGTIKMSSNMLRDMFGH